MTVESFITDFLFYSALIELLLFILLKEKNKFLIAAFDGSVILLIVLPRLLDSSAGVLLPIPVMGTLGLLAYPLAATRAMDDILKSSSLRMLPLAIASALALAYCLISGPSLFFIAGLLIIYDLSSLPGLLTGIKDAPNNRKIFILALFVHMAGMATAIVLSNETIAALSTALMIRTISLIFIIGLLNRASSIPGKVLRLREQNRRLIRNIARLSQREDQMKRLIHNKDLELLQMSKFSSLAEITAGIAHELAQPLTGIKGIAQNMIDDINFDEFEKLQAVSELLKISILVDKSSSIISHVRSFAKKSRLKMEFIDFNALILHAIDLVLIQFKKCDIDIVLNLHQGQSKILGDWIALEQMIINLLLNARDAILEKRKRERPDFIGIITLTTRLEDDEIQIVIEDNGTGISHEILGDIWAPFFTTKKRTDGTGIGLSISKKIIQEHHGEVSVQSRDGIGTQFTISFPLKKEDGTAAVVRFD